MAELDEDFLPWALQALERLRDASEDRGHPLLASMLELARVEAEDDLKTRAMAVQRLSGFREAGLHRMQHLA